VSISYESGLRKPVLSPSESWEPFLFPKVSIYILEERKNTLDRELIGTKTDKTCFWHIDYLLTKKNVQIQNICVISFFFDHECSENKKLIMGNASIVAKGFGATDCQAGCGAHLLYLGI